MQPELTVKPSISQSKLSLGVLIVAVLLSTFLTAVLFCKVSLTVPVVMTESETLFLESKYVNKIKVGTSYLIQCKGHHATVRIIGKTAITPAYWRLDLATPLEACESDSSYRLVYKRVSLWYFLFHTSAAIQA